MRKELRWEVRTWFEMVDLETDGKTNFPLGHRGRAGYKVREELEVT